MKTRIALVLLLTLSASCGPASQNVEIRLRTGLENVGRIKNLMTGLSNPALANQLTKNSIGRCLQKNLYAGFNPGDGGDENLETTRIPITLNYDDTTAYSITSAWVQNSAEFPPISLSIPRGIPVGVGILGTLTASRTLDALGGTCADFDPTPAIPTVYSSTSVIGHTRIIANSTMDVPLKIWVTPTNVAPQPTPAAGCALGESNQNCPFLDYFKLTCDTCQTDGRHLRLEYAYNRLDKNQRVIQWVPSNDTSFAFVPDLLPLTVTVTDNHLQPIVIRTFLPSEFNGAGNQVVTQSYSAATVANASGLFLSVTRWSEKIVPILTAPSLNGLAGMGTGANTVNITWSQVANVDQYIIRYATTSGGPFNTEVTRVPGTSSSVTVNTLPAPGPYYLVVEATNFAGSTPIQSNFRQYNPIGAVGALTVTSNTAGNIAFSWPSITAIDSNATLHIESFDPVTNASEGNCNNVVYNTNSASCPFTPGTTHKFRLVADNSYGGYSEGPMTGPFTIN